MRKQCLGSIEACAVGIKQKHEQSKKIEKSEFFFIY